MGRGRGKGKKSTMTTSHEDQGSGEEEKIPTQKRRGRPQKPLLKDEIDEEGMEKLELKGKEDKAYDKAANVATEAENGKKRRRSSQSLAKEAPSSVKDENVVVVVAPPSNTDVSTKSNGFRHIGSRRKSKPRRAAEVGVECN
ncbi:hypothetical protein Droror1_Dr00023466 [Drosera rotundifolia]